MKRAKMALAIVLLGYSGALQACSVGMATSGHELQDTSIAFPGSNRSVIISELAAISAPRLLALTSGSNRSVIISKLGPPETSRQLEDGKIEDSYLAQTEEPARFLITYDAAGTVVDVQKFELAGRSMSKPTLPKQPRFQRSQTDTQPDGSPSVDNCR